MIQVQVPQEQDCLYQNHDRAVRAGSWGTAPVCSLDKEIPALGNWGDAIRLDQLAGNTIWQDRRFLARYMPDLERYLHYRIIAKIAIVQPEAFHRDRNDTQLLIHVGDPGNYSQAHIPGALLVEPRELVDGRPPASGRRGPSSGRR